MNKNIIKEGKMSSTVFFIIHEQEILLHVSNFNCLYHSIYENIAFLVSKTSFD